MKKFSKIYLPLLCLLLLVISVAALSACGNSDCDHDWELGTTVSPGCTHNGANAYTCKECGDIKTELLDPIGHSFTTYVDDGNATCEEEGTKTALCDNGCGATDTKAVPKRHTYSATWTSNAEGHFHVCSTCQGTDELVPHTADESGLNCSACGYVIHTHTAAHVAMKPATCTEGGNVEHWYCAVCDTRFTDENCTTEIVNVAIAKLGHSPRHIEAKAPSCTATGNVECYYCENCDKYYTDDECTDLLADADRILAALPHQYTKYASNATQHWLVCSCGDVKADSHQNHTSSGPATDIDDEVCTVCNYVITPALNHTHDVEHIPASAPDCVKDGNVECYFCEGCGRYYSDEDCTRQLSDDERIVEKLGHISQHRETTAPTCETDGYQEHWYCQRCEKCFSDKNLFYEIDYNNIVRRAKHTGVVWTQGVAATCTKDGNITYWHCQTCDKYYSDEALTTEITLEDTVIQKTGHSATYVKGTPATCTKKGTKDYYTCANCKKSFKAADCREEFNLADRVIDAVGHQLGRIPTSIVAPTCTSGGYSIFKCEREGCQHAVQDAFTPIADCDMEEVAELATPSTCQTRGTKTYRCTNPECLKERVEYLPKSAHNYEGGEEIIAPTCTEAGYTKHTCQTLGCGYSYMDNQTAATGHDTETSVTLEATCTTAGTKTTTCKNDGCEYEFVEVIAATGHTVSPTCEATSKCANCEYVAPATGHNYAATDAALPTCEENGYVIYTCSNEGCTKPTLKDYPEDFKATGHHAPEDAVWTETKKAVEGKDCTFYIERSTKCKDCDHIITTRGEEYVEHKEVASIKVTATCQADGKMTYTCSECQATVRDDVPYSDPDAHTWAVTGTDGTTTYYSCVCGATKTSVSVKNEVTADVNASDVQNSDDVELKNATFIPDQSIKDSLTGSISLGADTVDKSTLGVSAEILERIGDATVYDFTLSIDGQQQSQLAGDMTIRIPYDLGDDDPENIMVWYIDDEGNAVEVKATYSVIEGEGYAVFTTNHFSTYTVTKMNAEERCKLYGHVVQDLTVPATCLTDGYTMHVCVRCGHKEVDSYVDALGHEFVLNEETYVERSCTENGYAEYECERCFVSYEVKENSTGHTWIKDTSLSSPASCTQAGETHFYCEGCSETKVAEEAMLDHKWRVSVVAPTCTEDGYTSSVCRVCSAQSKSNVVEALGHDIVDTVVAPTCIENGYTEHQCDICKVSFEVTDIVTSVGSHVYDKENASCTEDKVCSECGALAAKATGHKFATNGLCANEGCTVACEHSYSYLKDVDATCTKPAHKVEQCAICFGVRDVEFEGSALAHEFENGVCKSCGMTSGNYYLSMVETWKNTNGFALEISDFSLNIEEYVAESAKWYVNAEAATLNVAKLMIYTDANGKLAGAITGSIEVIVNAFGEQKQVFGLNAVIENGYVYMEITGNAGEIDSLEEQHIVVSLDEVVALALSQLTGIDKGIGEQVSSFAADYLIPMLEDFVTENEQTLDGIVGGFVNMLFEETATEDGFAYVLSYDKIREVNASLASDTIAEFIDKYFGYGAFDGIVNAIDTLVNTKVPEIPALAEKLGISREALIEAINAGAALMGEEKFDVTGWFESEDNAEITVGMFLFQGQTPEQYGKMIDDMVAALRSVSLYTMINPENPSAIKDAVNKVISDVQDVFSFSYETNAQGAVLSLNIGIENFEFEQLDESEDGEIGGGNRINVSLDIKLTPGGRINVNFDSIITEINTKVNFPDLGDVTDYNGNEPLEYEGQYPTTVTFGNKVYEVRNFTPMILHRSYTDLKDPFATMIMAACGESYIADVTYKSVIQDAAIFCYVVEAGYLVENAETGEFIQITTAADGSGVVAIYPDGSKKNVPMDIVMMYGMSYMMYYVVSDADGWFVDSEYGYISSHTERLLYNAKTGEFEIVEPYFELHTYELDEERSQITDECEAVNLLCYVCQSCGDVHTEYDINYHHETYEYRLMEGSLSCEDGVEWVSVCLKCNEVLDVSEEHPGGHIMKVAYTWDDENDTLIQTEECLCGLDRNAPTKIAFDSELDVEFICSKELGWEWNPTGGAIKITPTRTATYEIWSEKVNLGIFKEDGTKFGITIKPGGTVSGIVGTNPGGSSIIVKPDGGEMGGYGGNLAAQYAYELVAGESYYIVIEGNKDDDENKASVVHINERTSQTVELSEYGCTCGATMTITDLFDRKSVEFSGCAEDCELYYELCDFTLTDEDTCERYDTQIIYFFTEDSDEPEVCELFRAYTGYYDHNIEWKDKYNQVDSIENGKAVSTYTDVSAEVCQNCGAVTWKHERISKYDKITGKQISEEETYYYYSVSAGEAVIDDYNKSEFVYIIDSDGYEIQKIAKSTRYYYSAGELYDGYTVEYEYPLNNPCIYFAKWTTLDGTVKVQTVVDHREDTAIIPEESTETTVYDEEGRELIKKVIATETYCVNCYASISKKVEIQYSSTSGDYVKYETEHYESYAESDDDYGYRISQKNYAEYGIVFANGDYHTYPISEGYSNFWYDEQGEVKEDWHEYFYIYQDNDFCHYTSLEKSYYNPLGYEDKNVRTSHVANRTRYSLKEGSNTCLDGIVAQDVCDFCGEADKEGWEMPIHYHDTNYGTQEIIDLTPYGSKCGSYVEINNCLCGAEKNVHLYEECQMVLVDEDYETLPGGYREVYISECAVSDCDFKYTYEYIVDYDANCRQNATTRYTYGEGDGALVIEDVSYYGGISHDTQHENIPESEYTEDGYNVVEQGYRYVCKRCGAVTSEHVTKTYSLGTNEVKQRQTDLYYNEDRTKSYSYISEQNLITFGEGEYQFWLPVLTRTEWYDKNDDSIVESWNENEYSYVSGCPNTPTVTVRNSNSDDYSYQNEHERYELNWMRTDVENTCSQYGYETRYCQYCDYEAQYEIEPMQHDFQWDEFGCHCYRCGLESFDGVNGNLVLEDLSESYGEDEYFVIGFWNRDGVTFTVSIGAYIGGFEYYLEVQPSIQGTLVYVSIADVACALAEMSPDYNLCNSAVVVSFISTDSEYDFVYSITLDSHSAGDELVSAYDPYDPEYTAQHAHKCEDCGETLAYERCQLYSTQNESVMDPETQVWHDLYAFECCVCGLSLMRDSYNDNDGYHEQWYQLVDGEWIPFEEL